MTSDSDGPRGQREALWDWNLVSNRIHFSPQWLGLVGCDEHEIGNTHQAWLQRVHPEDVGPLSRALDDLREDDSAEFAFRHRMRHKDGSYRWMSCRGLVQRDAAGQAVHLIGSHSDVTAETVSDPVTGLPNRLLLMEHVTRSIERASRYPGFHFAVLCIDLDRPSARDAAPGSTAPDPLLTAAARRLETCLRIRDTPPTLRHNDLVARLQGDQFAILLDGLKEVGHARVVADRVLAEILAPFTVGGREVRLAANVGVAVSATGYAQPEDVLRDAETAVHRAKLLGGARCEVFDTAVLKSVQAALRLEADFNDALERREFVLFYQPIVSLTSDQIVGFEALVRWQHPVLGLIPPVEFIPLAEKTGFIVPLGRWILRDACLQLKAWQDSLPLAKELWVSVNLSSPQFKHPALVDEIGEALHDSGLDPRCLVLELTEGIAMENPTAVRTTLMQLRAVGVRVSMDDFGTGHSSLSYLRQFPLDSLKVDRSFVQGIEANKDMASIFRAVTAMAKQLGLRVVAEGIEKEEQLALVRSLDCESGQGYLFSKPLDHDRATALLKTGLAPRKTGPREAEAAPPPLRSEPSGAQKASQAVGQRVRQQVRALRPQTMRWLYGASAALLLVVTAGLPRLVTHAPPPSAPPVLQPVVLVTAPPVEVTVPPVETPTAPDIQIPPSPVAAPRGAAAPPAPPAAKATDRRGGVTGGATTRGPERAVTGAGRAAVRGTSAAVAPAPAAPVPALPAAPPAAAPVAVTAAAVPVPLAAKALTSLRVVHQHRFGSCRGLLVVSRDGLAFVPDEPSEEDKDAFSFKHNQFLPMLDGDSLTIKSDSRAYRFKPAVVAGKDDDQLQQLVASIKGLR